MMWNEVSVQTLNIAYKAKYYTCIYSQIAFEITCELIH